jgi:hypothetical protein
MLICGDVIRPGPAWMLTRTHRYLATAMAQIMDPDGFARLDQLPQAGHAGSRLDARIAATRAATLLALKGGTIVEITVGDCVELVDTPRRMHVRGGQKKVVFYLRLHALGIFLDDAPHTIRAFGLAAGRLTIEELVDRYPLQSMPIRNLIVEYLRERQPSLDFASPRRGLPHPGRSVLGPDRHHHPGIDTLHLPPDTARAWKEWVAVKRRTTTNAAGERVEVCSRRLNAKEELLRVRVFYPDIAQWATEDPARWAAWAVRCPMSDAEINRAKERAHRKSRMDQRTRERLPVLPALVHTATNAALRPRDVWRPPGTPDPER